MSQELPNNLEPPELTKEDKDFIEEEIVSPIQPHKSVFTWHMVSTVLLIVLAVGVLGYLAFAGKSALQLRVKVANAPEEVIGSLQMPVHTASTTESGLPTVIVNPDQPSLVQPPALILDETVPTPRISSTFTNEPSIATKPTPPAKVAGTSIQSKPAYTYTSAHGFSFRVPAGATVQEVEQGRVQVLNAKGKVLSEITILPNTNANIDAIPAELALSSNISDIHTGTLGAEQAYLYTVNGSAKGARVTHGVSIYYVTDYSGFILPTFVIR